jgi:flagellar hook assembly protein FlgD
LKRESFKVQPNPFMNSVQITFELPEAEQVTLEVYNAVGARVAILAEGLEDRGTHNITWDARGLINGIYFCRLQAGDAVFTRKIIKMD